MIQDEASLGIIISIVSAIAGPITAYVAAKCAFSLAVRGNALTDIHCDAVMSVFSKITGLS